MFLTWALNPSSLSKANILYIIHNALHWKYLAIQIVEVHSFICSEPGSILIGHLRGDVFTFCFRDHLLKTVWACKLGILISWNQALKTSWLKALRFMMVRKMDQDFPGRESTASAEKECLKSPKTWSQKGQHLLEWQDLLSHGVQML